MGESEPAVILDKVKELVVSTLNEGDEEVSDGMDVAFCKIDLKSKKLWFSGGFNGLYIVTEVGNEGDAIILNDSHKIIVYSF